MTTDGWKTIGDIKVGDKVFNCDGEAYPLDSLGIPAVVLADGPAGLRIDAIREGDSATYRSEEHTSELQSLY